MPSFFDLQKYAATGIASADMTAFDKARALAAFGGETVQTMTGVPPLTFKADGAPLISWSMLGNGQQTGTPTPDAPIMPEFVGVRTGNLFDYSSVTIGKYINANGEEVSSTGTGEVTLNHTDFIRIEPTQEYTLVVSKPANYPSTNNSFCWFDSTKNIIYRDVFDAVFQEDTIHATYTAPNNAAYLVINYRGLHGDTGMLNLGSTALPYEPFGYKVPISCAGQTTPIYIGDPLRKALDGSDAVDVLSSAGTITREVDEEGNALATPTTQAVDVPEIPTTKGQNTLTVDTDLQPSEMTIKYRE